MTLCVLCSGAGCDGCDRGFTEAGAAPAPDEPCVIVHHRFPEPPVPSKVPVSSVRPSAYGSRPTGDIHQLRLPNQDTGGKSDKETP